MYRGFVSKAPSGYFSIGHIAIGIAISSTLAGIVSGVFTYLRTGDIFASLKAFAATTITTAVISTIAVKFPIIIPFMFIHGVGSVIQQIKNGELDGMGAAEIATHLVVQIVFLVIYKRYIPKELSLGAKPLEFLFKGRGGKGFPIGKNAEVLYQTPSKGGGTIFSYVNKLKRIKFRIDWDGIDGFHYHWGTGKAGRVHRSFEPWTFPSAVISAIIEIFNDVFSGDNDIPSQEK